jgi:hypothetical protein
MPPLVAVKVSLTFTRIKFPSGVMGPRISRPSRVMGAKEASELLGRDDDDTLDNGSGTQAETKLAASKTVQVLMTACNLIALFMVML